MALPISDKYFHPLHHATAKKVPLRPVTLAQTEPKETFVASSHEEFKPVSAQQMRSLVIDKDKATLQAYRPEIQSGQAYAVRGQDGQLHMVTHHPSADTFVQFDKYFREGGSAKDSCQFLRGEGEGAAKAAHELGETVRHPINTTLKIQLAVLKSGPALVDFSRNSAQITADAAQSHVAQLTDPNPRLAGQAWGGDLFTTGASMAPFPLARYLFRGAETLASSSRLQPLLGEFPAVEKTICQAPSNLHPDALLNADKAVISPDKLKNYCLDMTHEKGGHKAFVFDKVLGYNQSNVDELMEKIAEGVKANSGKPALLDKYGQRHTVDMKITGPTGRTALVRTGWIYDPGSLIPRLTTAIVK